MTAVVVGVTTVVTSECLVTAGKQVLPRWEGTQLYTSQLILTTYNRKKPVYHTVNGNLHCFTHQKQQK